MNKSADFSFTYTDRAPAKVAKPDFFYQDDFLIHVVEEGSTVRLYCMIGYGNEPTELTFTDVSELVLGIENFNDLAPLEVTRATFRSADGYSKLSIKDSASSRKDAKRIKWREYDLFSITYKEAFIRDCAVIVKAGEEYRRPERRQLTLKEAVLYIVLALLTGAFAVMMVLRNQ